MPATWPSQSPRPRGALPFWWPEANRQHVVFLGPLPLCLVAPPPLKRRAGKTQWGKKKKVRRAGSPGGKIPKVPKRYSERLVSTRIRPRLEPTTSWFAGLPVAHSAKATMSILVFCVFLFCLLCVVFDLFFFLSVLSAFSRLSVLSVPSLCCLLLLFWLFYLSSLFCLVCPPGDSI